MNKALAVIGKIIATAPIDGADRIQQATVVCGTSGKWQGVVGKDISIGDIVMVFLQDAILPPDPRWAFMEKHQWRVRMARFKGVPSECLIVPCAPDMPPGTDITATLGVTKHEKPIPAAMTGDAVGAFPSIIPKTGEPNFQTVPEFVERLAESDWYAAEKADGSSTTAWVDDEGELHVASRNWELREFTASGAGNSYWRAARKYGLENLPRGLALQFEIVGPGIQGNPMGLKELEARAFSLYDIGKHCYLPVARLREVCKTAVLGIPVAREIDCEKRTYTADELRKLAEIRYSNGKHGEGIVIRANDSSWSFKVLNLRYEN